ncbi:TetR/AcrR family transcriptional regulator [Microbacterium sediminicola]|uniref:TetR/AcrR family transcriptional regulator n=1 Tax=Microbacterium sediminicola TaxID=415210 RepID=A0ABN2HZU9_9MICO
MTTYHHGDLPRQLLDSAAEMAASQSPESISLRELARRAGVSHSAPVHHFGTRQGLLTALAIQGFEALGAAIENYHDDIYAMGVTYVQWALAHPGHYAVMWEPRLLDEDDDSLRSARAAAWTALTAAVARHEDPDSPAEGAGAYAAFALVHGLAGILLSGAVPAPADSVALAREVTQRLRFAR